MQDAEKEMKQHCYRMDELANTCSEDIKAVWKETDNCALKEKVRIRMNASIKYVKDIEEALGEDFGHCIFFANAFRNMSVENYLDEVWTPCENWRMWHEPTDNIWLQCLSLIGKDNEAVTTYEYEKANCPEKVSERCNKHIDSEIMRDKYLQETGKELEEDPNDIYSANGSYTRYSRLCFCFEFMFCWLLYRKIDTNLSLLNRVGLLKSKLELGCLCIALTIEKRKLGIIYDFSKRDLSEDEANEAKPEARKTKQPREVFTERAKEYFAKAEEAGYLKKVGNKYEWLYCGGKVVALIYFFIRTYEPESPPYEQLEPVFGVKNLTSSRSNLVKSTWYKHELKRKEMTPEELRLEERQQKLSKPVSWFPELKNFFD